MGFSEKTVYAMIESIVLGEKFKPIQKCIRRCLSKYGIIGTPIDRKASAIVYNVFRSLGLNDRIIESTCNVRVEELDRRVRGALRLVAYIYHVDKKCSRRIRELIKKYTLKYIARIVGLEKAKKYESMIIRITGTHWRPSSSIDEVVYTYRVSPKLYSVLREALRILNEDVELFLKSTLKPPPHTLRVNRLKADVDNVIRELTSIGCIVERGRYSSNAIIVRGGFPRRLVEMIENGILIPQDEASMVAVELLDPREGMDIADLCAAPGGKTTYLAEYTNLKARIYSFEIFEDRARRLRKLLKRTSTSSVVKVYVMDARNSVKVLGEESMDIVLIDPPCSSTGALAKNPDVRWRYDEKSLNSIVKLQRTLLDVGFKLLKPGGRMMYTTCSVLPWENEYIVKDFIEKHSNAKLIALSRPFKKSPILQETLRSWPHIHNVTGFFYALIEKKY